ncbi:MAG: M23 family metallopeptidase [Saprospiraceae bacterium]|nr:M23 family metallopeptidase [Saprospiraceae bacterium]
MSKQKYYYNPQTLQYESYALSWKAKLFRVLSICCGIILSGAVIYFLADTYLPSQKERALMRELDQARYHYQNLQNQVAHLSEKLGEVQERDARVHRFVFGADPIDQDVWTAGIGGHDKYADLLQYPNAGDLMLKTQETVDQLQRQLSIQELSLDSIETLAYERARMFDAIPSIKPVRVDLLKRNVTMLSGFGMRLHPIHKIRKMHWGIDLTAPRGTPIQATGSGTVVTARNSSSGLGRHVVIDHGYGYETVYGHMHEIMVKVGDKVRKGQQIGTVGSSGTSTAPHCHYEIHQDGRPVDPIHYCLDGLTPAEYRAVVKKASEAGVSFD